MKLQTVLTTLQIISIVFSLGVGTLGFFMKREVNRLDNSDKENKTEHQEIRNKIVKLSDDIHKEITKISDERQACNVVCVKALSDFKEEAYTTFVRNAEFIRINTEVMKKLDKIFDMLYEMKGR